MGDGFHAQLHGTRSLGRDHLAMVVVEALEDDGWRSGAVSGLRERRNKGETKSLKREQERLKRGSRREKLEIA